MSEEIKSEEIHDKYPPMLTLAATRAMMRTVVMERPDYVYEPPTGPRGQCAYWHWPTVAEQEANEDSVTWREGDPFDGEPGCLIAVVLTRLFPDRVTPAVLCACEGGPASVVTDRALISCEWGVRQYLDKAQQYQDSGVPWGEVFNRTEYWIEEIIRDPEVRKW